MKRVLVGFFLGFFVLSAPMRASAGDRHNSTVIEMNIDEAQELLKIAYAEAGNQGEDGQWLVMSVIINRVNSSEFPNTIHEVIYQPGQFYTEGMSAAEPTADTHLALARIECGEVAPYIVAFETDTGSALDKYFSYAFQYRNHKFYTRKEGQTCRQ